MLKNPVSIEPFVVGKTYVLNENRISDFIYTPAIRRVLNLPMADRVPFTFTPTVVIDGVAYVDNHVIASEFERDMFDIVQDEEVTTQIEEPEHEQDEVKVSNKKTYAPFKENAIYKLRKKYVDKFGFTNRIIDTLGFSNKQFAFTVLAVDSDGDAWGENNTLFACKNERYMFKRIDNK